MNDADDVLDEITAHAAGRGIELYPHQEEAVLELLAGNHVVLATPTGSGKSLVALAAPDGCCTHRRARRPEWGTTPRRSRRW